MMKHDKTCMTRQDITSQGKTKKEKTTWQETKTKTKGEHKQDRHGQLALCRLRLGCLKWTASSGFSFQAREDKTRKKQFDKKSYLSS